MQTPFCRNLCATPRESAAADARAAVAPTEPRSASMSGGPRVIAALGVGMLFFGGLNFAIGLSLLGDRGSRNRKALAELAAGSRPPDGKSQ